MGRDGAERTTAKTAAMDVDGELNHLVGGNALALVFWMRIARIGQVERSVQLFRSHRRIGRVDHHVASIDTLQQALGMHHIRLFLNMAEVLCLCALVLQTLLMAVEYDVALSNATGNILFTREKYRLRDVRNLVNRESFAKFSCQLDSRFLTHAVGNHVGTRVAENTLLQLILPVVVVRHTAQGCLDATQYDGHIRIQLAQYLAIDDGRIFWTHVMTTVRTIGILRAQTTIGGVFVDHRVHTARGNAKEEARASQLLKVSIVAMPVGLWHDGHTIACCFQGAPNDGSTKRGVIHIRVS